MGRNRRYFRRRNHFRGIDFFNSHLYQNNIARINQPWSSSTPASVHSFHMGRYARLLQDAVASFDLALSSSAPASVPCFNAENRYTLLKERWKNDKESSRRMIKEKFTKGAEDDISVTSLRISLICPIGKTRIITPSRGSGCKHLQCFDALNYLKLNTQRSRWRCPVCDRGCPEDSLIIDTYFAEIIQKNPVSTDVVIREDGISSEQTPNVEAIERVNISTEASEAQPLVKTSLLAPITTIDVTTADYTIQQSQTCETFIDLTVDSSNDDTNDVIYTGSSTENKVSSKESSIPKPRSKRVLFHRRIDLHPFEIQAQNVQCMSDDEFDNFLIDNGLVLCGHKVRFL